MARKKRIDMSARLARVLPKARICALAREHGVIRRHRRVRPVALLWSLVFGFVAVETRAIAGLRRFYGVQSGRSLSASAFYARFSPALVRFLKGIVGGLLERVCEPNRQLRGALAVFKDLVVTDATVMRLHDFLAKVYPGCRTNQSKAALKLHVVMSALAKGPRSVRITGERKNDGHVLRVGPWVRGRLILFDLAYFRYQLFDCIERNGGYFIARLMTNVNPTIVLVHRAWRGRAIELVDRRLLDVLTHLDREILDVEVEVGFQRRTFGGKRSDATTFFRLVGVRNEETRELHLYLTNVPPHMLQPEDVARTYRARWLVEILFKELKSTFRIDRFPSANRNVVEALLYAALIAAIVTRDLLAGVRMALGRDGRRATALRFARLMRVYAADLLRAMLLGTRAPSMLSADLTEAILREARDPNRFRLNLLEEVEIGEAPCRRASRAA